MSVRCSGVRIGSIVPLCRGVSNWGRAGIGGLARNKSFFQKTLEAGRGAFWRGLGRAGGRRDLAAPGPRPGAWTGAGPGTRRGVGERAGERRGRAWGGRVAKTSGIVYTIWAQTARVGGPPGVSGRVRRRPWGGRCERVGARGGWRGRRAGRGWEGRTGGRGRAAVFILGVSPLRDMHCRWAAGEVAHAGEMLGSTRWGVAYVGA